MRKLLVVTLLLAVGCGSESSGTGESNVDAGSDDGIARTDVGVAFNDQGSSPMGDATSEASTSIDAADASTREETAPPDAPPTPDSPSMTDVASEPSDAVQSEATT